MSKKLNSKNIPQAIRFLEKLIDTKLWVLKAEELLAAAHLLKPEIQAQWAAVEFESDQIIRTSERISVHGPYFILVAYAIENLFKAVLIHRNRESLRNRLLSSLPRYVNEHDLIKLARRVEFTISVQDEDILFRLTRNSVWAGRYPVPTGPNFSRELQKYSDGNIYLTAYFAPTDVGYINELLNRINSFVSADLKEEMHNESLNTDG